MKEPFLFFRVVSLFFFVRCLFGAMVDNSGFLYIMSGVFLFLFLFMGRIFGEKPKHDCKTQGHEWKVYSSSYTVPTIRCKHCKKRR